MPATAQKGACAPNNPRSCPIIERRYLKNHSCAKDVDSLTLIFIQSERRIRVDRTDVIVSHQVGSVGWNEFGG